MHWAVTRQTGWAEGMRCWEYWLERCHEAVGHLQTSPHQRLPHACSVPHLKAWRSMSGLENPASNLVINFKADVTPQAARAPILGGG